MSEDDILNIGVRSASISTASKSNGVERKTTFCPLEKRASSRYSSSPNESNFLKSSYCDCVLSFEVSQYAGEYRDASFSAL